MQTTKQDASWRAPSPFADSFFLTGATASGKTALGVAIARELGAEIVSLDSMAVYRKMDVGTAKPTLEERGGVPHHMLDVVELRDELRAIAEKEGPYALWSILREEDPESALRLHQNDVKRVVRAIEVVRLTGKPMSAQLKEFSAPPLFEPGRIFILTRERDELYDRINRRVDEMMRAGFLEETRRLFESDPPPGPTASKAVGYRELKDVLDGRLALDEAVETIKRLTRNFAKRQETWFRSLTAQGARRIDAAGKSADALREEICGEIRKCLE